MHKWKLFKKSAALVLSSAVIASGVPVTAMAAETEAFSDVSGETQEETVQEEDLRKTRREFPKISRKLLRTAVQKIFRKKIQNFLQKRFSRKKSGQKMYSRKIQKIPLMMEKLLWQRQKRFFRTLQRSQ